MTQGQLLLRRIARLAIALGGLALLAGCEENAQLDRSLNAIPNDTLALMQEKGVTSDAPLLIRAYKQESEFEVWKRKADGRYVYLKTFPMCRWSGQLGPKMREGDRQSPEGFYAITPGQLNPNSNYYLSFNVGYPNAYDRAHGATGGHIMVHGICSSSGCFSMTNQQMGEIYALVREAFNGGQHSIQMQALPFRMTVKNLAKHRFDPNMQFWRNLKEGADNFEVTKQEPIVGVCAKKYVFNAMPEGGRFDASAPCPRLREDESVKGDVAAKEQRDDAQVAALVAKGERAVRLVYVDGSQNPVFYNKVADVSAPEGLTSGPSEVAMDEPVPVKGTKGSKPGRARMLAKNEPRATDDRSRVATAPVDTAPTSTIVAAAPAATAAEQPLYRRVMSYTASVVPQSDATDTAASAAVAPLASATPATAEKPLYQRMLSLGGSDEPKPAPAAAATADPAVAQPADKSATPATDRHASAASKSKSSAHAKRKPKRDDVARIIEGSTAPIGKDYMAFSQSTDR